MFRGLKLGVIAAHGDDEAFGAGIALARHGGSVWYGSTMREGIATRVDCEASCGTYGSRVVPAFRWEDDGSRLDAVPLDRLVTSIDGWLRSERPDVLLVPGPCHHQEHEAVRRAAEAAARPWSAEWLRGLFFYEYPFMRAVEVRAPDGSAPLVLVPSVGERERQVAALRAYEENQAGRRLVERSEAWFAQRGGREWLWMKWMEAR